MTKGYFLRTKAVIRPSLLRNFTDLSRRRVGRVSDKVRRMSCSDPVPQRRQKTFFSHQQWVSEDFIIYLQYKTTSPLSANRYAAT